MQKDISPEEKLLNLIKQGEKDTKNISTKKSDTKTLIKEPSAPANKAAIVKKKAKQKESKIFFILNKILILFLIGTAVYMVFGYLHPYRIISPDIDKGEHKDREELTVERKEESPSLSHYTDVLSKRQIFKVFEVPKPKPAGPVKPKISIQQIVGGYTFVGILFGDQPQAIVEDKKTGQSYYLTAGQFLGEMKVEKVEKGKVTLSYEDEKIDINI